MLASGSEHNNAHGLLLGLIVVPPFLKFQLARHFSHCWAGWLVILALNLVYDAIILTLQLIREAIPWSTTWLSHTCCDPLETKMNGTVPNSTEPCRS